jgi:hypothetical protein
VEEGEPPLLSRGGRECPELGHGPDGSGFMSRCPWPFGPLHVVAAYEFIHDHGVMECLPERRMQVSSGRDGERLAGWRRGLRAG